MSARATADFPSTPLWCCSNSQRIFSPYILSCAFNNWKRQILYPPENYKPLTSSDRSTEASIIFPSSSLLKKTFFENDKKIMVNLHFSPLCSKKMNEFLPKSMCVKQKHWWETSTHFLNQYVNMNCDNVLKNMIFSPSLLKKWKLVMFCSIKKNLYSLFVTPEKSCQNFSNLSLIWSMLYSFIFFCAMTPIDFFLKCVRLWLFFLWKHMLY